MSTSRFALSLLGCATLCACSAMTDPISSTSAPRSLAKWVLVTPAAPTLVPGQSLFLEAQLLDKNEQPLTGQPEQWSSSDTAVAIVDSTGFVTARAVGEAKVFISSGSTSAFADITVSNQVAAARWVSITPGTGQVSAHSTMPLVGVVSDAAGRQVLNVPLSLIHI